MEVTLKLGPREGRHGFRDLGHFSLRYAYIPMCTNQIPAIFPDTNLNHPESRSTYVAIFGIILNQRRTGEMRDNKEQRSPAPPWLMWWAMVPQCRSNRRTCGRPRLRFLPYSQLTYIVRYRGPCEGRPRASNICVWYPLRSASFTIYGPLY